MNDDDEKSYKDFMHDLEWGNLIDDDLLEPLDSDDGVIFDETEEIDEDDYEGL